MSSARNLPLMVVMTAVVTGVVLVSLLYVRGRSAQAPSGKGVEAGIEKNAAGAGKPESTQSSIDERIRQVRALFVRRWSVLLSLIPPEDGDEKWRLDPQWQRRLGDAEVVAPALKEVLADRDLHARIRASALYALLHYDLAETRRLVCEVCERRDPDLNKDEILGVAIHLAGELRLKELFPTLERLLRDPALSKTLKEAALKAMLLIDRERAEEVLVKALADSEMAALLETILAGLAELGTPAAARAVLNRLLGLPDIASLQDEATRRNVWDLLAILRKFPPEVLEAMLKEHLSTASPRNIEDRNRIVMLVGSLRNAFRSESLLAIGRAFLAASGSPAQQGQSIHLIAEANSKEAAGFLMDILAGTTERHMVPTLLSALSRIDDANFDLDRLGSLLAGLLSNSDPWISSKAAEVMASKPAWLSKSPQLIASLESMARAYMQDQDPKLRDRGAGMLLGLIPSLPDGNATLLQLFPSLPKSSDGVMLKALKLLGSAQAGNADVKALAIKTVGDPGISVNLREMLAGQLAVSSYAETKPAIVAQIEKETDLGSLSGWARLIERHDPDPVGTLQKIVENAATPDAKRHLELQLRSLKMKKAVLDKK